MNDTQTLSAEQPEPVAAVPHDQRLWSPSDDQRATARITAFMQRVNEEHLTELDSYDALYDWSVARPEDFWEQVWEFFDVIGDRGYAPFLVDADSVKDARFFPTAQLNFAENLLRPRDKASESLVFWTELGLHSRYSYEQLCQAVSKLQQYLGAQGVGPGDRVAAYLPNMPETLIAMLATASLGAVFASASPDFGAQGVLDRFTQIEPKILLASDGYIYAGKHVDVREKVAEVAQALPSVSHVLICPLLDMDPDISAIPKAQLLEAATADFTPQELSFYRQSFDAPLYIMFSSGTTGVPKCIIHRQGGVLLKHLAEQGLNCDIRPLDRVFYFTTCGWMMWNWLVSALALDATVVLYDGSPFHPNKDILFDLARDEDLSFFGTSAKYIDACRKAELHPNDTHYLPHLRMLASTGSPLVHEGFDYVYDRVKEDLCLASVSGGTDIVGCFMGGSPISPVYRGEIQKRMLGMATQVFNAQGEPVVGEKGELVCTKPFPTVPLGFWGDVDGSRFIDAYFSRFPGVWTHGDYVELRPNGGMLIYGRSDATLNPGGVRIGTAEIYRKVERFHEIAEALVIGQDWEDDTRVVLFVRMQAGHDLDQDLMLRIREKIFTECSPRHVPALILDVADIPRTKSGKIVELAVRDVVHGRPVQNIEALANPEALALFANIEALSLPTPAWPKPQQPKSQQPEPQELAPAPVQSPAPDEAPTQVAPQEPPAKTATSTPVVNPLVAPHDARVTPQGTTPPAAKPTTRHVDQEADLLDIPEPAPLAPLEKAPEPEPKSEPQRPSWDAAQFMKTTPAPITSVTTAPVPKDSQETMDADEREEQLFEALPAFMQLAKQRAPFWDAIWDVKDPNEFDTRAALASFPLTPLDELYEAQDDAPPFGGLTTTPLPDLKHVIASVTGARIAVGRFGDWANAAPALYAAGVTRHDVVLNAYSFDGGVFAAMMQDAIVSLGATSVAAGGVDTDTLLQVLVDSKATCFVGPMDSLCDVLTLAQESGRRLHLKRAVVDQARAAFPHTLKAQFPGLMVCGAMMDDFFGMIAYQPLGEEAFVCSERLIVEVVDQGSGQPVNPGEIGELVISRLDKHTPLFRIATGVLTRQLQDISPSQRSNTKIAGFLAVAEPPIFFDDGSVLHAAQILGLMESLPGAEAALVQLDSHGLSLNLVSKITADKEQLLLDATREFKVFTGLDAQVHLRPWGSIQPGGRLLLDRR